MNFVIDSIVTGGLTTLYTEARQNSIKNIFRSLDRLDRYGELEDTLIDFITMYSDVLEGEADEVAVIISTYCREVLNEIGIKVVNYIPLNHMELILDGFIRSVYDIDTYAGSIISILEDSESDDILKFGKICDLYCDIDPVIMYEYVEGISNDKFVTLRKHAYDAVDAVYLTYAAVDKKLSRLELVDTLSLSTQAVKSLEENNQVVFADEAKLFYNKLMKLIEAKEYKVVAIEIVVMILLANDLDKDITTTYYTDIKESLEELGVSDGVLNEITTNVNREAARYGDVL